MTACIAPKPGIRESLRRGDPVVRQADYVHALRFWLALDEPRIAGVVFADNSGHPLDAVRAAAEPTTGFTPRRPVEFHSFDFPAPPAGLNYGWSEFQLVNATLARSDLLAGHPGFIKATGRYTFPDVRRLLDRLPPDFDVAVDCRVCRRPDGKLERLASTPLALFGRDYYARELAPLPEAMVPGPPWNRQQYIEMLLYDRLYPNRHDKGVILRWPCNCEPVGIGANGDDYRRWPKRARYAVRAVTRRVFPWLWL